MCERWCVTKMFVKDGVWQSCVWKMMCDKDVCERSCVTKLCVKDGVWRSCVRKMVCDEDVCERWCVTKMCVKDGVWQSWCVIDGVWQRRVWKMRRRRRRQTGRIQNQNMNPTQRWGKHFWDREKLFFHSAWLGPRNPHNPGQTPAPGSQPRESKKAKFSEGKGPGAQWLAYRPSHPKVMSSNPGAWC